MSAGVGPTGAVRVVKAETPFVPAAPAAPVAPAGPGILIGGTWVVHGLQQSARLLMFSTLDPSLAKVNIRV